MKAILFIAVLVIVLAVIISFAGFIKFGDTQKTEERWNVSDGYGGSVNGSWGVVVNVNYMDGSSEALNDPPPLFEIGFRSKKVDSFEYILYTKGTSDTYSMIEVDLSGFEVTVDIASQEGEWGSEFVLGETFQLSLDDVWYEVYSVVVYSSELEVLSISDESYNLTFSPSGTISYRGDASDEWAGIPLPDWFYMTFKVREETSEPDDPEFPDDPDDPWDPEPDKWIEIELGSGTE